MAEDKPIGGKEWTMKFMAAVREAVTDAVEEHHRAGRPVYFMDDNGDIFEWSPDKTVRRLSDEEIERLLASDRARHGTSFLVMLCNEVIAEIRPPSNPERPYRVAGVLKGKIRMAEDFDTLPGDILSAMEGSDD